MYGAFHVLLRKRSVPATRHHNGLDDVLQGHGAVHALNEEVAPANDKFARQNIPPQKAEFGDGTSSLNRGAAGRYLGSDKPTRLLATTSWRWCGSK